MPAVQLVRLKKQAADLIWNFTRPVELIADLRGLFEFYADWNYRPGLALPPTTTLPSYHTSPQVLRELELAFYPPSQENPSAALELSDLLWQEPYLEPRKLSAIVLGQVPLTPPDQVLNRLRLRCQTDVPRLLLNALVEQGGLRLQRENPALWLELVSTWLTSTDAHLLAVGIKALLPLVRDPAYENLPPVFTLFIPLLEAPTALIQVELIEMLHALAHRTPAETTFILRQTLTLTANPNCLRIVRKAFPGFPAEMQASLRELVKGR